MSLLIYLEEKRGFSIQRKQVLSGGNINVVYKLRTNVGNYVLKCNSADFLPDLFVAEAKGLEVIAKVDAIKVPQVIDLGRFENQIYLLLEYIEPGTTNSLFWRRFGAQLANLHQCSNSCFGLKEDNFIGTLPQINTQKKQLSPFYIKHRLKPQFEYAANRGFRFKGEELLYTRIPQLIPEEIPALIHGDLWTGNFFATTLGFPCLIDPSVSYFHREADLAMMTLFGSVDPVFFEAYETVYALEKGWKQRQDLWQLYYLLVHLNLFGSAYLASVKQILKKYT